MAHGAGAIDAGEWDLVPLDLMLPGADGWDLCRHLRERDAVVPIIMLSARNAAVHRVLGLELGADDYLGKPFSTMELVARVRALLRRAALARQAPATAPEMHFGGWRLDARRRALCREGTAVPLTLREFDLLHFLACRAGQVFSRAELLEQVWGYGFDGYEHIVNSHINRLRAKIEGAAHEVRLIETVWGVGYRFSPPAASPTTSAAPSGN